MIRLGRASVPTSIPLTTLRVGIPGGIRSIRGARVARRKAEGIAATRRSAASVASQAFAVIVTESGIVTSGRCRAFDPGSGHHVGDGRVTRPESDRRPLAIKEEGEGGSHPPGTEHRNPFHQASHWIEPTDQPQLVRIPASLIVGSARAGRERVTGRLADNRATAAAGSADNREPTSRRRRRHRGRRGGQDQRCPSRTSRKESARGSWVVGDFRAVRERRIGV